MPSIAGSASAFTRAAAAAPRRRKGQPIERRGAVSVRLTCGGDSLAALACPVQMSISSSMLSERKPFVASSPDRRPKYEPPLKVAHASRAAVRSRAALDVLGLVPSVHDIGQT